MKQILDGLAEFQAEAFPRHKELFKTLAKKQEPEALFITCSDSRVVPNLMVQADPGDLFIVRNAGNIVPHARHMTGGLIASIEYAVEALNIRHIVLCGHTNCGAMKGILHPEKVANLPAVSEWVQLAAEARERAMQLFPDVSDDELLERVVEQNVIVQVKNLLSHSFIRKYVEKRELEIYGWVYDIVHGTVLGLDESGESFSEVHAESHGSPDEQILLRQMEADEASWGKL